MFEDFWRLNRLDGRVREIPNIARYDQVNRLSKGTRNDDIVLYVVTRKRKSMLDDEPVDSAYLKIHQTVFQGRLRLIIPYLFAADVVDIGERRGWNIARYLSRITRIPHSLRLGEPRFAA